MNITFGLDEVGRGAFAGPLVAAAVSLPLGVKSSIIKTIEKTSNAPVRDSKKLTTGQRQRIFDSVVQTNIPIFIASISSREINQHSIGWANKQIFTNLIQKILICHSGLDPESIQKNTNIQFIIDGNLKLSSDQNIISIPKADALYPEVSLASIVAKVVRDAYMHDLHIDFPHFGFNTNMGYGTKAHISTLEIHGLSLHHRKQFVDTALSKLKK